MNLPVMKIVFMGTPAFAVASLDAILNAGFEVAAVVTSPDKPSGRGMRLQQSEVKKYALAHHLHILQPPNLKSPDFHNQLRQINPDIQVVVAFRMLPEVVWNMPPLGTINLHASLLPQYRGAAPINWAVINGETETGVTTFKLKHEIDTGNILLQEKVTITASDNAGSVHDKLMHAGASLLVTTLQGIRSGTIQEVHQETLTNGHDIRHAPKIFTEDCEIKWNEPTVKIHNLIRGLSPFPGAFSYLKSRRIKILESKPEITKPTAAPGAYITDGKTFLKFATPDGYIHVLKLKPEGKGEMKTEDFLRGWRE